MSTSEYSAERLHGPRFPRLRAAVSVRPASTEGWIVFALVIVAAVIRIIVINNQSFWADEALTAYEARLPFGGMLNVVLHFETTPPLYFFVIWAWGHVLGTGEVALRSVSTLAGIALVPIAYLSASELCSRRAGVLAAAFVTVNPFLIWYSQEARAYMLLAALCGASFLWFVRARQDPSRRHLAWWAIWSALALATHFFAGFLVAPEALWLLTRSRGRPTLVAVGAVAVVQAAMLPFAVADTGHGVQWIARVPRTHRVSEAIAEWAVSIVYRRAAIDGRLLGGAVLVALVVLLAVLSRDRVTRTAVTVAGVIAAFVWIAPLALAYVGQDYFLARNVIPAMVPLVVAIAAACAAPRVRLLGGALAVALLALFVYGTAQVQTHPRLQRPDWRAVVRALGPATVPRVILAADGPTADPLKIYLPGVDWTEPRGRRLYIKEVDVVGARKRLQLVTARLPKGQPLLEAGVVASRGSPVPRREAVGATLLSRFRVDNWILARFVLRRPIRVSIAQMARLAPRYFLRTPALVLVFVQPAAHLRARSADLHVQRF